MARELDGGSTSSCGDQNDAFCSRGELQIPIENGDKDFVIDNQCTEAANLKILEAGKLNNDQMANVLLSLRPLGLKLSVSSVLSDKAVEPCCPPKFEDYSSQPASEKLKAANFEAVLIKIGKWERKKKNEGDIIAKCYFAKKKLVWEFLQGNLKSKIEIQWNEIIGIRVNLQQNKPGILELELNKAPDFFEEIDPQPRKHTIWRVTSDFTGGEASTFRRHYVVFPPGLLDKHYEKLLQCDQRLYGLSLKPFPSLTTPYFEQNFHKYLNFSPNYQTDRSNINLGFQFDFSSIPPPIMATHPTPPSFNKTSPVSVMDFAPSDEHITSLNSKRLISHSANANSLPFLPAVLSYQNCNRFSGQANQDANMVNCMLTSLADHLFSENQVAAYDEEYHMKRVESLRAIINPSQESEEESSQFGQEISTENGLSFNDQTFYGQDLMVSRNYGRFFGSENGLILSQNNLQPNGIGGQVAVYREPIHPQDPLIQQAWENLTDPRAENFGQDIDIIRQINRWR